MLGCGSTVGLKEYKKSNQLALIHQEIWQTSLRNVRSVFRQVSTPSKNPSRRLGVPDLFH